MKKYLRVVSLVLVTTFLFVLAVGCATQQEQSPEENAQTEPPVTDDAVSNSDTGNATGSDSSSALPIVDEPVTINYLVSDHETIPLSEDDPLIAELQKRTNVYLKYQKVPENAYKDKLQIAIASGDIPDMVYCFVEDTKKYGPEGVFAPLNSLLEEYGPNIIKSMEERQVSRDLKAIDGEIYGIPGYRPLSNANTFMVRKDWMDKLELEVPDTYDDFYNVLKEFKAKDPAGNNTTIPYSVFKLDLFDIVFDAFGGSEPSSDKAFIVKDGKMVYGPAQPGMKEMMIYLNKLYSEGLLDSEFAINSKQQWDEKVSSGRVGATTSNVNRIQTFTDILQKSSPEAEMVGIPPLTGPDGKKHVTQPFVVKNMVAISPDTKYADIIVKFFNYVFSDEGKNLVSYGLEGVTYTMKDGKPVFIDDFISNPEERAKYTEFQEWRISVDYKEDACIALANAAGSRVADAIAMQSPYYQPSAPLLTFTDEENSVVMDTLPSILSKTEEYIYRFIIGQEPISNWDKYVDTLRGLGLDELEKIYNDAYERYMK